MPTNELSLGEAIRNFIRSKGLDDKVNQAKIIRAWPELMGDLIGKRTKEIYVREKVLFIKISSSALKNDLSFSKGTIKEKLNEEIGNPYLKDVVFL